MKIYKTDTDIVYFAGDLHGEFAKINVTINNRNIDNCIIIFCGDIGLGFEKEEYYRQVFNKITKKTLEKHNIHLYMFRGNHDNKDYFDGEHFTEFEYVHIIPDYSVIQTPKRNILCVGGATSIDRLWRKENEQLIATKYMQHHNCGWKEALENASKLYWENESPIYNIKELKEIDKLGIKIDTVCTHSAPSQCNPITKIGLQSWLEVDPQLEEDLSNERKVFDNILEYLKKNGHPLENWYYGHFHFKNVEIIDGVKYKLLDMTRLLLDLNE